jgi:ribonuclease P protein component
VRWYASLRRSGEIAFVRRRGVRAGTETLAAHTAAARGGPARIAITVSKAVGGAVVRNRVKRRIKGALDRLPAPAHGLRVVIVARPVAAAVSYDRLARDVSEIMARLRPR